VLSARTTHDELFVAGRGSTQSYWLHRAAPLEVITAKEFKHRQRDARPLDDTRAAIALLQKAQCLLEFPGVGNADDVAREIDLTVSLAALPKKCRARLETRPGLGGQGPRTFTVGSSGPADARLKDPPWAGSPLIVIALPLCRQRRTPLEI
jgi:hypothetical protein